MFNCELTEKLELANGLACVRNRQKAAKALHLEGVEMIRCLYRASEEFHRNEACEDYTDTEWEIKQFWDILTQIEESFPI